MNLIERAIRVEIAQRGSISFARFMGLALYSPESGYYETHDRTIGRSGDFFTSVSVGGVFGQLIARRIHSWMKAFPAEPFQILEAGAHRGDLADDILTWLSLHAPETFARCKYCLVEPSRTRQSWQAAKLSEKWGPRVRWVESLDQLTPFRGVVVANELLDAFPVHPVIWNQSKRAWVERGVGLVGESLGFVTLSNSSLDIPAELKRAGFEISDALLEVLPEGYVVDLCPTAIDWWKRAAESLELGWMLTFDYGALAEELLRPERLGGTLRAYSKHQQSGDLLANPGEQDLTAHVNFSAIVRVGEECGLRTDEFSTQGQILTRWVAEAMEGGETLDWNDSERRQFQTLVHPAHLGRSFRGLVQSRGVSSSRG